MLTFTNTKAYSELKELAKKPFNLNQDGAITPKRLEQMVVSAPNWNFLYGFQRVDEAVILALTKLAQELEVHDKMAAMQKGEKINQIIGFESENRAVLHTAMRDIFSEAPLSKEYSDLARIEHAKLKEFCLKLDKEERFTDAILVGIGGSELGPHALYDGLYFFRKPNRRLHFISNIDPDAIAMVKRELDLSKTLVIIVSKSGSTLETATNEAILRKMFNEAWLNPNEHFISITSPKSMMDDKSKYRECFYLFDCVGGRYSSTSMVGALPLAFACGYEVLLDLLKGAHEMDLHALEPDPKKNLPLLSALLRMWNRNFLQLPTIAIIPYAQVLARFPAHLQQCDMESNGKSIDKMGKRLDYSSGAVIWGEPGTSAQHSFFQLIHQGTDIIPLEFIGLKNCQGGLDFDIQGTTSQEKLVSNLFAQALSLATGRSSENPNKRFEGNRPSSIFLSEKLTPRSLGSLLALYEHTVAYQGFIWGINSFDQEGVQLGKVLADQFMKAAHSIKAGKPDPSYPVANTLFEMLKRLK